MELSEKGFLEKFGSRLAFGGAPEMVRALNSIAYGSDALGRLLGHHSDRMLAEAGAGATPSQLKDMALACTTTFGGLGYAGVHPKAFPGMFTAYGTSNRGRGDHTYAWTIQAEEAGLKDPKELAAYVAEGQSGKALVDSLGLCDFFTADVGSELFLSLYQALTGISYSADSLKQCGQRIYALERSINNLQGRDRAYDSYVPPKLTVPLTSGGHQGDRVDPKFYGSVLDAYYEFQGWTDQGLVEPSLLRKLGVED